MFWQRRGNFLAFPWVKVGYLPAQFAVHQPVFSFLGLHLSNMCRNQNALPAVSGLTGGRFVVLSFPNVVLMQQNNDPVLFLTGAWMA